MHNFLTIGQNRVVKSILLGSALALTAVPALGETPSPQAQSLFEQGKAYHDGSGVAQDLAQARALYEQAAAQNHNFARINLGYMYFVGEGVAQDYEQSRSWYYRAAIDGDKDAQKMMVVFYQNGLGVGVDMDKAAFWKTKAESLSDPLPSTASAAAPATANPSSSAALSTGIPAETVQSITPPSPAGAYPAKKPAIETVQAAPVATPETSLTPKTSMTPKTTVQSVKATENSKAAESASMPVTVAAAAAKAAGTQNSSAASPQTSSASLEASLDSPSETSLGAAEGVSAGQAAPDVTSREALMPGRAVALPQGASLSLIAVLAVLAFAGALWFLTQLSKLLVRRDKHRFAVAFYEHHREDLRSTFLRIPEEQRLHRYIDDPWVVSVSVLMIRFAQTFKTETGKPYKISKRIIDALRQSPLKARQEVFGIMPFIQNLIMLDINSSENEGGSRDSLTSLLSRVAPPRGSERPAVRPEGHALNPAE